MQQANKFNVEKQKARTKRMNDTEKKRVNIENIFTQNEEKI